MEIVSFRVKEDAHDKEIILHVKFSDDLSDENSFTLRLSLYRAKSLLKELEKKIKKLEQLDAFVINEYLMLKLINGKTIIFVDGKEFNQCKFLQINIPHERISEYDHVQSIDEASRFYGDALETAGTAYEVRTEYELTPEQEFQGHCSNLQAWADNDYNTVLLHRSLAFPLLKKLAEAGDPKAKKAYREEIISRLESNEPTIALYLVQSKYLAEFNEEEMNIILENLSGFTRVLIEARIENKLDKYLRSIQYDAEHGIITMNNGKILLTSPKNKLPFYNEFVKTISIHDLKNHARALFGGRLFDFGIRNEGRKIVFSKEDIRLVRTYFKNKDLLLSIPRKKAPLKIHHEQEEIIAFIQPKEVY